MNQITFKSPDDMHLHVRDGEHLPFTLKCAVKQCSRAIIMPNIIPPVINLKLAMEYKSRILDSLPKEGNVCFEPLMTLYMTDQTTVDIILEAKASGVVHGVKLYPKGATTNSENGVTKIENIFPVLTAMEQVGMPLLLHGEVTDIDVDVFDREHVFIETVLGPLTGRFPHLKIVLEHVSTKKGVEFIRQSPPNVVGTITAHHLLYNRNSLFEGGLNPHLHCMPVLKTEADRVALLIAASSGSPKFFLGSDSAPHVRTMKETSHCAAGVFSGYSLIELYLEAFDSVGAMDKFECFASIHGALFYGIDYNQTTVCYERKDMLIPECLPVTGENEDLELNDKSVFVPLRFGQSVAWTRVV